MLLLVLSNRRNVLMNSDEIKGWYHGQASKSIVPGRAETLLLITGQAVLIDIQLINWYDSVIFPAIGWEKVHLN